MKTTIKLIEGRYCGRQIIGNSSQQVTKTVGVFDSQTDTTFEDSHQDL